MHPEGLMPEVVSVEENIRVGPLSMKQNNTQMKTLIFWKGDDFSGWFKNYLISKYLSYAVYACAFLNNKQTFRQNND